MFNTPPPSKVAKSPTAVIPERMRAGPSSGSAAAPVPGQVRKSVGKLEANTRSPPPKSTRSKTAEARAIWVHAKTQLDQSGNIKTSIKTDVHAALKALYEMVKQLDAAPAVGRLHGHGAEREQRPESTDSALVPASADRSKEILEEIREVKELLKKEAEESKEKQKESKKALEEAETRLSAQITYAQVAAAAPTPAPAQRKAMHSVIVTSPDVMDTSDTVMEKIKNAVQAAETGVRVERVRRARNQAVVITCREKEELEKVVNRLRIKKTDLNIEEARNKNPMVVVKDVMQYLTDDDLTTAIVKQNGEVLEGIKIEDADMKVKFRRKARNPLTSHVVLQVTPTIWQRLTAAGRIHIDLQRVAVQDQSPLIQCTKCLGYGHGRKYCKETEGDLCSHCGGPHLRKECEAFLLNEAPECRNCKQAKKERLDHNAFDKTCSVRRKWEEVARSAVAYC